MRSRSMRRFWDDRASENPHFFADNRLRYSEPDLERPIGVLRRKRAA